MGKIKDFYSEGGTNTIKVTSDRDWTISSDADWLSFNPSSGTSGVTVVSVTAEEYTSEEEDRTTEITAITTDNLFSAVRPVTQKKVSGLPDIPFLCNYNAKTYNNGTILKTDGQLFDEDLVLTNPEQIDVYSDHIYLDNSRYAKDFLSASDNPFNLPASNANLTVIAKYSANGRLPDGNNLISNRNQNSPWDKFNWMYRVTSFHDGLSEKCLQSFTGSEQCVIVRITNNQIERWLYGSENRLRDTYQQQGNNSPSIMFFYGYASNTYWEGDFYWVYVSKESLTDEEIEKVILYNNSL